MDDLLDRFFSYLESLFEKSDITVTQPIENAAATAFISCIVSLFLAAFTAYFGYNAYRRQRNVGNRQILHRMTFEVSDIIRHIVSGLKILEIADENRMLSTMHFKKMRISKQSLFFDAEMPRYYPSKYDRIFRKCALLLRNHNIELDAIISYVESVDAGRAFDSGHYRQLLEYYKGKSTMLVSYLQHELCFLAGCSCKKCPLGSLSGISFPHAGQNEIYAFEGGFFDESGLCLALPETAKKRISRYRRVPLVGRYVKHKTMKKYIRTWKSPDSIRAIVYQA